jgi:ferric-dicitrate binding protein FerR (iron transport regulator)
MEVEVLGTTFNISSYAEKEWVETSLVEGQVKVNFLKTANKQVVLKPNEKTRYNKKTELVEYFKTDLKIETAWKRGDLIFSSEALSNVLKQLESFYGVEIKVKGLYPTELFTGRFHENEVNAVLRNLQLHYKFSYQKSGDYISIIFK